MVRARCTGKVCLVAGVARGRSRSVVVVGVALGAWHSRVRARQRIIRIRSVIEVDVRPIRRVVTRFARGWECNRGMVWIGRTFPVRLVAAVAGGRQRCVVVVGVALRACHRCMRSRQREYRGVIEARRYPCGG